MKYASFLLASLVLPLCVGAQKSTQTLYYPNGQKRLEGACTFTLNPYFNPSLIGALFLGESSGRRRYEDGAPNIPDADYPVDLHRSERPAELVNLSMVCDGPVTLYYANGSKQVEMMFKAGVPSGPTTMYYPEGGVLLRGSVEAGVPTGVWTRYYKAGGVFSTGKYIPKTQAELRDTWQAAVLDRELEEEDEAKAFTEEGVRNDWSDETRAATTPLLAFRRFTNGLMHGSRKDGPFTFYRAGSKKWAEIHYAADVRTGTWTIWNERGKPTLKIEYNPAGRLVAVTDSTGKRQMLEALTKSWKETEAARRSDIPQYGDPNGIDPGIVEAPSPPKQSTQKPSEVFTVVDLMPEFNGNIQDYLSKNLRYPAKAKKDSIEGRVVVQFVVKADGSITDAKVLRGIGGGCDEEALRLVRAMPKWKPGKLNGKPVAARFNLPILFKLK